MILKNKILVIALSTSLMMNFVTYHKFNQAKENINDLNRSIKMLNRDLKAKKSKIMELEDVIQNKDHELKIKQEIINNQNKQINQKDSEIKKLQKQLGEIKKQINFNKKKKGSDVDGRKINVIATAYVAKCREGCTGVTATGVDVSNSIYYKGMRIIAVDTNFIKLGSIVEIDIDGEKIKAIALDTGGKIKNNKIDFLVGSEDEARRFGVKNATIRIIKEG